MSFNIKCSKLLGSAVVVIAMFAHQAANAWDGYPKSTISSMDVTDGASFGLRISLSGVASMCTGGPNWAYINDTDSNYKAYAAALMMAKAQGSKVTVYSNRVGTYCKIGYISIE
jgi:hypothetical protein